MIFHSLHRGALLSVLSLLFLCACTKKEKSITRAFYNWKTSLQISAAEKAKLESVGVHRIYTRFFDVNLDAANRPVPVAKISIDTSFLPGIEIVPVVYILNKVLLQIQADAIDSLAGNIFSLVTKISQQANTPSHEIQLDCDWSLRTKENYFSLINCIRKRLAGQCMLSCTIRLHQVKYFRKTGVPPVDRGMLMFYNMGNLEDSLSNSIFNEGDASKYLPYIRKYPIPLDVVLPIFGWYKHYSGSKVTGLINDLEDSVIQNSAFFTVLKPGTYLSGQDMFFRGRYFHKGDRLVAEKISTEILESAADLLEPNLKETTFVLSFYYWDKSISENYAVTDLERLFHLLD